MKLSIVILTHNEEKNILDCLENLSHADDIVIVDDYSDDRTIEIVKSLNSSNLRVFKRRLDSDFSDQRNFGLNKAKNDWVLFLDADERAQASLLHEINNKINSNKFDAYNIKRTDVLWGRKLKFGETGNIKLIRLAKKNAGKWKGKVHEAWDIKRKIGELNFELLHHPHQTIKEFISEVNFYSTIRAKELKEQNIRASFISIITYTKAKFILNYFIKLGFLDGIPGLLVALMMSFHSFLTRSKLWLSLKK